MPEKKITLTLNAGETEEWVITSDLWLAPKEKSFSVVGKTNFLFGVYSRLSGKVTHIHATDGEGWSLSILGPIMRYIQHHIPEYEAPFREQIIFASDHLPVK